MEINGVKLERSQDETYHKARACVQKYQPLTLHEENKLMQVFVEGVYYGLEKGRTALIGAEEVALNTEPGPGEDDR